MESSSVRHALRGYSLIDQRDAVLPLTVREVFFNFSVYESVKIIAGTPLFLQDHIERLFESARRLRMEHPFEAEPLTEAVERLIEADQVETATLRIQLIGGISPELFTCIQQLPTYPERYYQHGVPLISYSGERVEPEVKSNSLLLNYIALREAEERGAFEAVLVDRNYKVLEGTRTNVFGIREHTLYTPGRGVLAGVTRKYIIEAAEELGMQVVHAAATIGELKDGIYEEFFISSTSMGALPAASVDGVVIGTSFPRTNMLNDAVRKKERSYLEQASGSPDSKIDQQ